MYVDFRFANDLIISSFALFSMAKWNPWRRFLWPSYSCFITSIPFACFIAQVFRLYISWAKFGILLAKKHFLRMIDKLTYFKFTAKHAKRIKRYKKVKSKENAEKQNAWIPNVAQESLNKYTCIPLEYVFMCTIKSPSNHLHQVFYVFVRWFLGLKQKKH